MESSERTVELHAFDHLLDFISVFSALITKRKAEVTPGEVFECNGNGLVLACGVDRRRNFVQGRKRPSRHDRLNGIRKRLISYPFESLFIQVYRRLGF